MGELEKEGYVPYNDITRDWNSNLLKVRSHAREGKNIVMADIMFCVERWRSRLERELSLPVQWIFFENNPWQCARNCLYRFMYQNPQERLKFQIRAIRELSAVYSPFGEIRPVVRADAQISS